MKLSKSEANFLIFCLVVFVLLLFGNMIVANWRENNDLKEQGYEIRSK